MDFVVAVLDGIVLRTDVLPFCLNCLLDCLFFIVSLDLIVFGPSDCNKYFVFRQVVRQ